MDKNITESSLLASCFPARSPDAHKGDLGKVLILACSPGLTGAGFLAAQAAVHTGSGLVTLGVPRALNSILETKTSAVMTWPLICTRQQCLSEFSIHQIRERLNYFDAIAIGPGIGRTKSTARLLAHIVKEAKQPLVLDADALHLMLDLHDIFQERAAATILTPHLAELSVLSGIKIHDIQKNREKIAKEQARYWNAIVLLKGPKTLVTDGKSVYVNKSGNSLLASGGSGDVLTGVILSLLGQGLEPCSAAAAGTYLHGLAADRALDEGRSALPAEDLISYLDAAHWDCKNRFSVK